MPDLITSGATCAVPVGVFGEAGDLGEAETRVEGVSGFTSQAFSVIHVVRIAICADSNTDTVIEVVPIEAEIASA